MNSLELEEMAPGLPGSALYVYEKLSDKGQSQAEIGALTGLSHVTVRKALSDLIDLGVVVAGGRKRPSGRRGPLFTTVFTRHPNPVSAAERKEKFDALLGRIFKRRLNAAVTE